MRWVGRHLAGSVSPAQTAGQHLIGSAATWSHFAGKDGFCQRSDFSPTRYFKVGVYSDKKVIDHLVALLGDKQEIIVNETSNALLEHREKAKVRRVLESAAKNHENKVIRAQAQALLDRLDKK